MKLLLSVLVCFYGVASESKGKVYTSEGQKFKFETLVKRQDVVWGFDFLKNGRIIFTERGGQIGIYHPRSKAVSVVTGAPQVFHEGQGGLLDIRVHPKTQKIYLTYSDPVGEGKATTSLAVATLVGNALKDFKKIFTAHEPTSNEIHFGSRIEFDGKGHLFVTIGERNQRERAQDLTYHQGKILRLNEDGSVPKDNPFSGKKDAKPEIWSYGHRSPQGLALHPLTQELWMAEMGPKGGDEINLVKPGANYGWPVATFGKEYSGFNIGPSSKPGTEQPIVHWVPSISPSGLAIYSGSPFAKWKGNLFLANLSDTSLMRVVLKGHQVVKQEKILKNLDLRFRNVRTGPEGALYVSTDEGHIARLVP